MKQIGLVLCASSLFLTSCSIFGGGDDSDGSKDGKQQKSGFLQDSGMLGENPMLGANKDMDRMEFSTSEELAN